MQSEYGEGMIGFVSTDNKVVVVKQKLVIKLAPKNEKLVNDSACALNVPINLSTLEDFVVFLGLYSNFDSKTKQPERKGNPIVSTPMWDFLETRPEGELVYFLKAALNLKMEKLYDFAARIGYACGTRNPRRDGMPGSAPRPCSRGSGQLCQQLSSMMAGQLYVGMKKKLYKKPKWATATRSLRTHWTLCTLCTITSAKRPIV